MTDSIIVRVSLDRYDLLSKTKQTQVYVQIPKVARASWLLDPGLFHGLKLSPWPDVVDAAQTCYVQSHAVTDAASSAARAAVLEWLRDDANRDEMQVAFEEHEARRHPVARKLLEENEQLRARVTELEGAAVEGRAALAALCYDLEDPGTAALGALYLLQQATTGTPMEPGEAVPKAYRASHDSIGMGLYLTAAAAREHCEAYVRREMPSASLDWIEDEEDGIAELAAAWGEEEITTGYVVTALDVASEYDEEADE